VIRPEFSDISQQFKYAAALTVMAAACFLFPPVHSFAQGASSADVASVLDQVEAKARAPVDAEAAAKALVTGGTSEALISKQLVVDLTSRSSTVVPRVFKDESRDTRPVDRVVLDTLELRDMDINDVLKLLAQKSGLNIISGRSITGRVTIYLTKVEVHDAMMIILKANDLAYIEDKGVLQIVTMAEYEQINGRKFGSRIVREMIMLQSMKAVDAVAILNQVKSPDGKIVADERSNTIYLEDSVEKIKYLEEYIRTIDFPLETRVFKLQYAQADALALKIQELLGAKSGTVKFDALSNKLFVTDSLKNIAMIEKVIQQVDIPSNTEVFKLSYAKAENTITSITPLLTKDVGHVEFDARSNSLVVTDIPPKINQIRMLIKALDVNEKQVLIDARIIQIGLTDNFKMGVNWEAIIPNFHELKVDNTSFGLGSAVSPKSVMSIGTLNQSDYFAALEVISTLAKSRVLSNPRIAVVNNQEAQILIGTTKPYVTTTTTTTSTGPTISETVNFIDVGVKLFVTPNIHDDGYITMKVKPEVSTATTSVTTSEKNEIPIVDTSKVETTVRVKDGVTIIIGGLIKDEMSDTRNKVPLLGDIPLLGKVFRHETRTTDKTEIVIFLTPHIISGDAQADTNVVGMDTK